MTVAQIPFEAFFLDAPAGRRFCVYLPAQGGLRGAVIHAPPLAEEHNRARRMAALQARAFAAAGLAVLLVDPGGCGDSEGEFGDATWEGWVDDLEAGARWLRGRAGAPLWIWGLRAGALLAAGLAARDVGAQGLVLWQPVISGEQALRQFLRLKAAAEAGAGRGGADLASLRRQLDAGGAVDIAGYTLGAPLARGLAAAELRAPGAPLRIECFELAGGDDADLSPGLAAALQQWQAAGHRVRGRALDGPAFWQTAEQTSSPALIEATTQAVVQA